MEKLFESWRGYLKEDPRHLLYYKDGTKWRIPNNTLEKIFKLFHLSGKKNLENPANILHTLVLNRMILNAL